MVELIIVTGASEGLPGSNLFVKIPVGFINSIKCISRIMCLPRSVSNRTEGKTEDRVERSIKKVCRRRTVKKFHWMVDNEETLLTHKHTQ